MSWKDILKELSPRERMDAEDFAPEEMQADRDRKHREETAAIRGAMKIYLDKLVGGDFMPERQLRRVRDSLTQMVRGIEGAPRFSRYTDRKELIDVLRAFLGMYDE